jgi:hypothetical protein
MSKRRTQHQSQMGPPPTRDVVMGPPPVPSPASTSPMPGNLKQKDTQEVAEKYRKLKRKYLDLEEVGSFVFSPLRLSISYLLLDRNIRKPALNYSVLVNATSKCVRRESAYTKFLLITPVHMSMSSPESCSSASLSSNRFQESKPTALPVLLQFPFLPQVHSLDLSCRPVPVTPLLPTFAKQYQRMTKTKTSTPSSHHATSAPSPASVPRKKRRNAWRRKPGRPGGPHDVVAPPNPTPPAKRAKKSQAQAQLNHS